jgi:cob(I)alamin adenosyltransferase
VYVLYLSHWRLAGKAKDKIPVSQETNMRIKIIPLRFKGGNSILRNRLPSEKKGSFFMSMTKQKEYKLKKGYTQIYTGDGKGKTTAAIGLAVRASGCGLKVFLAQFIKGMEYSEIRALKKFPENITVRQFGRGRFIRRGGPSKEDLEIARKGFKQIVDIIVNGDFDIVILDEVNVAIHFGLLTVKELIELLKNKPFSLELVLTGRRAPQELIEAADLVTEMKEIKHYFQNGVTARKGIER